MVIHRRCRYVRGVRCLGFGHLSQSSDGRSDSGGGCSGNSVSTTGNGLLTRRTRPDTSSTSLDGLLTTEGAVVSSVLLDFQLLDLSSQRGTVTDTVLTCDTYLLSSLSPVEKNAVSVSKNCPKLWCDGFDKGDMDSHCSSAVSASEATGVGAVHFWSNCLVSHRIRHGISYILSKFSCWSKSFLKFSSVQFLQFFNFYSLPYRLDSGCVVRAVRTALRDCDCAREAKEKKLRLPQAQKKTNFQNVWMYQMVSG